MKSKLLLYALVIMLFSYSVAGVGYYLYNNRGLGEPIFQSLTNSSSGTVLTDIGWTNSANCASSQISNAQQANGSTSVLISSADDQECIYNFPDLPYEQSGEWWVRGTGGDQYYGFGDGASAPDVCILLNIGTGNAFITNGYASVTDTGVSLTANVWSKIQFHYKPSTFFNVSIDGNAWAVSTTSIPASLFSFYVWENNGDGGYIDSFRVWNGTPDDDPIISAVDPFPAISFFNQTPVNITFSNVMDKNLTTWYNITDDVGLTSALWFYKTNTSKQDYAIVVNGTPVKYFMNVTNSSNSSSRYKFEIDDIIYPATYNLEHELLEDEVHLVSTIATNPSFIKASVWNVTREINISFLEVMINSSNAGNLDVYYCNNSYTTGNVGGSDFCSQFFTLSSAVPFNHSHSPYSFHKVIPFNINDSGYVGNVFVSSKSYFAFSPSGVGNSWSGHYIANVSRSDHLETSVNDGVTWNPVSGTLDMHLHQINTTDKLHYYACAKDTASQENCTDILTTSFLGVNLPPSIPLINSPTADLYNGILRINYTASVSDTSSISFYNITLLNPDTTVNQTITSNNGLNLNYSLDTSTVSDGNYTLKVSAVDVQGLESFDISSEFEIDNTNPTLTILEPTNGRIYSNDSVRFSFTCNDSNLWGFDVVAHNDTDYILVNSTRNLTGQTTYIYNNTINLSALADDTYTFSASCLDGHTDSILSTRQITKTDRYIEVGDVKLTSSDIATISYNELYDRVRYTYSFSEDKTHRFTLTSDQKIYYLQSSKYKGHFIMGSQWIDFEPYNPLNVIRYSDNLWEVYVSGKSLSFESIGDLNNITQSNSFIVSRQVTVGLNWTGLNPVNNSLLTNQTTVSFNFQYNNSNSNQSVCTLYRDDVNLTSAFYDVGLNNISDTTISSTGNFSYQYFTTCNLFVQGILLNTTVKTINISNTAFVDTTPALALASVMQQGIRAIVIIFFFVVHFIFLILALILRSNELMLLASLFGIMSSFMGIFALSSLIGGVGIFFLISYIVICSGFMFGVTRAR